MTAATWSEIPTTYQHTLFRSRLEARWAAFFDLVGWRFETNIARLWPQAGTDTQWQP